VVPNLLKTTEHLSLDKNLAEHLALKKRLAEGTLGPSFPIKSTLKCQFKGTKSQFCGTLENSPRNTSVQRNSGWETLG
jgi:hypothetical protein